MDKKITGLVCAVAALTPAAVSAAPVTPSADLAAGSYSDLLAPIPNAVEKLKASNALLRDENAAKLEMAQFYHHHHHHHFFHRPYYRHHHFIRRHHHHHHHHHHHFNG